MKSSLIWFGVKTILLLAVTLVCLWYLAVIFLFEFFNGRPGRDFDYPSVSIHITIMAICVSFFVMKTVLWWRKVQKS
jgi:hypothetical protein